MSENGSAIVLGVGPGLGAALARRFVKAGFSLCVAARSRDKVDAATADLRAAGATALGVVADATDEQSVVDLVAKTEDELGPLGVAIYNAGGFVSHDSGEWRLVRPSQEVVVAVANAGRGRLH